MQRFQHAEAFCLMEYTNDDGKEIEYIWNSRDGVTPFCIQSRLGAEMTHTNFQKDRRIPDYRPQPGSRIFIDMTPERAEELCRQYIDVYWDNEQVPMCNVFSSKEEAFEKLYRIDPGQPDIKVIEGGTTNGETHIPPKSEATMAQEDDTVISHTGDEEIRQSDDMQLVPLSEKEVRHVGLVWLTERHLHMMIQAPEGARILNVFTDHMRNAIGIMVESPELPECEEGCRPDDIPAVLYAVAGPDGSTVMAIRYEWEKAEERER